MSLLGAERTTAAVLQLLLPHRRRLAGQTRARPEDLRPQWSQLLASVRAGAPIHFVLPGFPCKSPNPEKVLGPLPDEGERAALIFLDRLCREVSAVYPPGARLTVCSDGHVFSDCIGVPDDTVGNYRRVLDGMIAAHTSTLDTFDLAHGLGGAVPQRRARLLDSLAPEQAELRAEVKRSERAADHYRGIVRFLVSDTVGHNGTRSALQRDCRRRGYEVIRRSIAWGRLIDHRFPSAVRLSIHPQPIGSAKLGIRLLNIADQWTTPWHACLLRRPDHADALLPHRVARTLGTLVHRDGRPSHFVAGNP